MLVLRTVSELTGHCQMQIAYVVTVAVVVLVGVFPARCRYELQNDVAGACSDFNTDSAPVMTLQLGGVLFGTAIACALPKNDRQSERNNVVFMAEVRC